MHSDLTDVILTDASNDDFPSEKSSPVEELAVKQDPDVNSWEIFLRVFIVAFGIILGAVLSLILGLAWGWIQFVC